MNYCGVCLYTVGLGAFAGTNFAKIHSKEIPQKNLKIIR